MADVKLVIKMPEEVYKSITNGKNYISYQEYVEGAIKNGTPLPEGHGDLIDYYDAVELINNKADEENSNFTINDIEKFGALLREVNPIIEADKAESEETKK